MEKSIVIAFAVFVLFACWLAGCEKTLPGFGNQGKWVVGDSRRFLTYSVQWSEPLGNFNEVREYSYHGDRDSAQAQADAMNAMGLAWDWDFTFVKGNRPVEEVNAIKDKLRKSSTALNYMD